MMEKTESYFFWRRILFVCCFIGHCLYYVTRKSTTYSIPILLNDSPLKLSKEDFGVMASLQMAFYTIGKFLTGFLVDRISCKRIFCFGLLCCGLTNIGFSFAVDKNQFLVLTLLNGLFQACGWNAIAVLIKRWYKKEEIGTIWSLLSSTINIGTSITPFIVMAVTKSHHWRATFLFLGIVACIFSIFAYFSINEMAGNEQIEKSNEKNQSDTSEKKKTSSLKDLATSSVFWTISLCYLLWSLVKGGTEDWLQLYLITERGLANTEANFNVMIFQIGGFVASLSSGGISDQLVLKYASRMKASPRLLVIIFCSTTSIFWFYLLHFIKIHILPPMLLLSLACFILGFCCYGPHTMFGLIVMESAPMEISGTAHALATTVSSVGSVLGGYPLVYISSNYGWDGAYLSLISISILTTCLLILLTRAETQIVKTKKE